MSTLPILAVLNLTSPDTDIISQFLKANEEAHKAGHIIGNVVITDAQLKQLEANVGIQVASGHTKPHTSNNAWGFSVVFRGLPWIRFLVINPSTEPPIGDGTYRLVS